MRTPALRETELETTIAAQAVTHLAMHLSLITCQLVEQIKANPPRTEPPTGSQGQEAYDLTGPRSAGKVSSVRNLAPNARQAVRN